MPAHIGFVGAQCRPLVDRLAAAGTPLAWCAPGVEHACSGVVRAGNAVALAQSLMVPRVVWLRMTDGFATELAIQDVWPELDPGDVIVDAGRGAATDGARRAASLASARIRFVDCGVVEDALYFGGDDESIRMVAPYAQAMAGASGWTHCGPAGTGYRP